MQSYIQYINKNGTIKAVEVERQEVGQKVRYVLPTIQEQFFILTVFDNNKRVLGLGFVDVENLDMLAFLNSDFQSVDALPEIAYFNAYQEIILETDLVVVQNGNVVTVDNFPPIQNVTVDNTVNAAIVNFSDFPQVEFPIVQDVRVVNEMPLKIESFPFYDPYRYFIDLNLQNKKIEGLCISNASFMLSTDFVDTLNNGVRSYQPDDFTLLLANSVDENGYYEFSFSGFTIWTNLPDNERFDFLLDMEYNIFNVVQSANTSFYASDAVPTYWGQKKGIHRYDFYSPLYADYRVYVAYKIPVGFSFTPW